MALTSAPSIEPSSSGILRINLSSLLRWLRSGLPSKSAYRRRCRMDVSNSNSRKSVGMGLLCIRVPHDVPFVGRKEGAGNTSLSDYAEPVFLLPRATDLRALTCLAACPTVLADLFGDPALFTLVFPAASFLSLARRDLMILCL